MGGQRQFDARQAKALQAGDDMTVPNAPGLRWVCSTAGRAWVYRFKSPRSSWVLLSSCQPAVQGGWPVLNLSILLKAEKRPKARR